MGNRKRSIASSESENWEEIFKGLVKILRGKEDQLQSLVKDRKILEDRIKTLHEFWLSDVQNYEYQLSIMKNEAKTVEMMRLEEVTKYDLMLELKKRDLSLCKSKLEHTQEELDVFKSWFDIFTLDKNEEMLNSGDDEYKSLEAKIRKQKLEFEKLAFEQRFKVSNLLQESGFAWNQFKDIESGFTKKLMAKDEEIKQANEKISSLQSSNHEKDEIISRLESKVSGFEGKAGKKDKKISRRSDEVKSVRRSTRLARKQN